MILAPTNRRIIRPGDKPSFEHTQRYGLVKGHPLGPAGGLVFFPIMNEGSGLTVHDLSGNRKDGTCVGTTPSWSAGKFGSAVLLPGINEYIDCGSSAIHGWGSGDGTVIIWFKMVVVPGDSVHDYLICRGRTHANGKRYYIETYNSTPVAPAHLYAGIDDNDVGGAVALDEQDSIYPGIDYCVALVRDGNTLRLYKNAIQVDSADITGYGAIDDGTFPNLIIGARHRADTSLIDAFSNVRIEQTVNYNRALSVAEIASVYWNPFCMVEKKAAPVYFFVPIAAGEIKEITGLIEGQSTVTGTLEVDRKIVGTIAGESVVTGSLEVARKFTTTVTTQSVVTGSIEVTRKLTTVITTQSIVTGSLAGTWLITGVVTCVSTVSGTIIIPAGGLSNHAELKILDHITGKTNFTKPSVYLAFCTADPGEEATGAACNEVSNTNGYARVAITADDWNTASGGTIDNANALTTPEATGSWGAITHFVLVNSGTYGEGDVLVYDELNNPVTVEEDDIVQFAAGELILSFD